MQSLLNHGAMAIRLKFAGGKSLLRVTFRGIESYCCTSQDGTDVTSGTKRRPWIELS